jgi:ABC-type transporter Mla MlaB component
MKLICSGQHWNIKNNQLHLDTPEGQDTVKAMVKTLESQIRQRIYDEICAIDLTDNRKQIMKNGLENSLLTVQDICAKVAIGVINGED